MSMEEKQNFQTSQDFSESILKPINEEEISEIIKDCYKKNIPLEISKLMLILKVHSLCKGFSGIRIDVIERICWHIEKDIIPAVPSQGSVGASGDLAPLAHLFLPLIGEGEVLYKGKQLSTKKVLDQENKLP